MPSNPRYPDTGESGETYDVEQSFLGDSYNEDLAEREGVRFIKRPITFTRSAW
jgi:hypothetical protein